MIKKCCICGNTVDTKFKLDFEDLFGAYGKIYTQYVGLCDECGYIFTQNPFTQEQLDQRYKVFSKVEYDVTEIHTDYNYLTQCQRQKYFISESIDMSGVKSVFEVGAASGFNLSVYKSDGVACKGVEPSKNNCLSAKYNYDIELFNGTFEEYKNAAEKEKFDLILLSMVLEHIVDPASFIHDCAEINSRYIFIEVPTLDVKPVEEPMGMFCEEHVSIFTLDSLSELMTRAGYRLISAENVYSVYSWLPAGYPSVMTLWEKGVQENRIRMNMFSSKELLEKYIDVSETDLKKINERINEIPNDMKLAVWGIGHHASMLLANTCLSEKNIVRVYDSDKRKHSETFAGITLRAFDKQDIVSGEVEGILLTTYTAQKAIIKYIASQQLDCRIFTLYDI
ncbi:MAG: class I SAM-dependent methyltransferase [Firmicutes bacterium]|nr:class I SAM-dependent methyltransferase [Bacillota bacterium]